MARRLPTWHWIRVVRAHGPRSPSVRAVLYALAVRMDDRGEAFPSQRTIASDTALSERTVRDAVLEARRTGWIAVAEHARPGQGWRLSHYVACVPDSLNLSSVDLGRDVDLERMSDQVVSERGEATDRLHGLPRRNRGGGPRTAKGAATIAARRERETLQGAAIERSNVRQPSPERAATIAGNVRQPSPTKFPYKFPSKIPEKGRIASDAPARVKDAKGKKPRPGAKPEPTAAKPNGSGALESASEVLRGFGGAEHRPAPRRPEPAQPARPDPEARIRKLILTLPHLSDGEVAKILGADPGKVRTVRHSMAMVA